MNANLRRFLYNTSTSLVLAFGVDYTINQCVQMVYKDNKFPFEKQEELNRKAKSIGIKENVIFYESKTYGNRGAYFPGTTPTVCLEKDHTDQDIYRELAHIKMNHNIKGSFVSILTTAYMLRHKYLFPAVIAVNIAATLIFRREANVISNECTSSTDDDKIVLLD